MNSIFRVYSVFNITVIYRSIILLSNSLHKISIIFNIWWLSMNFHNRNYREINHDFIWIFYVNCKFILHIYSIPSLFTVYIQNVRFKEIFKKKVWFIIIDTYSVFCIQYFASNSEAINISTQMIELIINMRSEGFHANSIILWANKRQRFRMCQVSISKTEEKTFQNSIANDMRFVYTHSIQKLKSKSKLYL